MKIDKPGDPQVAYLKKFKNSRAFIKRSSFLNEFLAEREEILKHKWLESEKVGYDIGFERALLSWIQNHRDTWRIQWRRRLAHKEEDAE